MSSLSSGRHRAAAFEDPRWGGVGQEISKEYPKNNVSILISGDSSIKLSLVCAICVNRTLIFFHSLTDSCRQFQYRDGHCSWHLE